MFKFTCSRFYQLAILLLISIIVYLSFGIFHLGKFFTVDEGHWLYDRIPQYWEGISEKNWELTYINDKPGVSLAIISGVGLLKHATPTEYKNENRPTVTQETGSMESFYFDFRLPILIFNGLFSIFFFWVLKKITQNDWIALWSAILILLSPILLGISQIVNPDSLIWIFSTATLLSFISFLKNLEKKMVFFTSLFLGLSLLTKYSSVILMPFLFVITFVYLLEKIEDWQNGKSNPAQKIKTLISSFLLTILGSLLVFLLLLPASFAKPEYLYWGTLDYPGMKIIFWPMLFLSLLILLENFISKNKLTILLLSFLHKSWERYAKLIFLIPLFSFFVLLLNYVLGGDFLHLENVPFDSYREHLFYQNNWPKKMLLEFRPIVFSVTPLVLFFTLFIWTKSFFKKTKESFLTLSLTLFIVIFIFAVIHERLLNIIRYSIVVYPLLSILAAIGLDDFFSGKRYAKFSRPLITSTLILFSIISLWQVKPFYFYYTNDLLPKKYSITDSWGHGGYEVAQYLNSLPEAKGLAVWTDNDGVCEFFVGKCLKGSPKEKCQTLRGKNYFDYSITTRRGGILFFQEKLGRCGENKDVFQKISSRYSDQSPEFRLEINKRPADFFNVFKETN